MAPQRLLTYIKESATLGIPYGVILIFGAFGPATTQLLSLDESNYLGTIFLLCISVSMLFTPIKFFTLKHIREIIILFTLITGLGVIIFPIISIQIKIIIMCLFGVNLGLFARIWAFKIQHIRQKINQVLLLVGVLFISYGLLYIANVTFPSIPKNYITVLPGLLLILCLTLYFPLPVFVYKEKSYAVNILGKFPPKVLIIIYIIFITAGFTYVGIYPKLVEYQPFDRYYNVLPFLLTLLLIPFIINKLGQRALLYLGITCLGLSYCFFLFTPQTSIYFLIQSFLQPGWAFLDFFAWMIGLEIASIIHRPQYVNKTVGAFLLGTFTGALLFQLLKDHFPITSPIFLFLSIVPLFMVIPLFFYIYQQEFETDKTVEKLPIDRLTKREQEIALHLMDGKSQKEILQLTNISKNTLKTHSRNIYRKLDVKNRDELCQKNMVKKKLII